MPDSYEDMIRATYTRAQRIDLMLTTLQGLIEGITADRKLHSLEIDHLKGWLERHAEDGMHGAIGELLAHVRNAIDDDVITTEEQHELLHLIARVREPGFYRALTTGLQELQAMVCAIAIDREINVDELRSLRLWLEDHRELKAHWPYDEIDTLVTMVMADGRIDPEEHRRLLDFFSAFRTDGRSLAQIPQDIATGEALYCTDPEVIFADRSFCITGASARATRAKIRGFIAGIGGIIKEQVVKDLDYLVVCDAGNPTWAYSSYGRKLEEAIAFRRAGAVMVVVRENDLWDGLADAGIEIPVRRITKARRDGSGAG